MTTTTTTCRLVCCCVSDPDSLQPAAGHYAHASAPAM
jgi:hypothetical protein